MTQASPLHSTAESAGASPQADATSSPPPPEAAPASFPIQAPLPVIRSPLTPAAALERLATASKRGRLAGFERGAEPNTFTASIFSEPMDHLLLARIEASQDGGSVIRSTARMLKKMPIIFAATLILTIWPGVYLTDVMIPGEWGWIATWIWYLPLTVIPTPWIWKSLMKKSRKGASLYVHELLTKIAAETNGRIDPATPAGSA